MWGTVVGTVAYVEANHLDWIGGTNIVANPKLNEDFTLSNDSLAINAGRHMTLTNGSGSNSTLLVCDDVYWAFSGPNAPWSILFATI